MSEVQAVYALEPRWSPTRLRAWLKKHNLKPIKAVHRLGTEIRYRIRSPSRYTHFTTQKLANGVYLVLGWL